jgi:hypothetical protein
MSGLLDQDTGDMRLDAVLQVYVVFSHGSFLQMIKPDVPMVLLDPGLNVFQPMSSLTGQRKLVTFLGRRPTVLMLCLNSILDDEVEGWSNKGQDGQQLLLAQCYVVSQP